MKASDDCKYLIKLFESCRLKAYPDPKTGGAPWTIGWGHTGPDVAPTTVWTQQQADIAFNADLKKFETGVSGLLKVQVLLCQFDALVSFAYNCGLQALAGSTLLKLVNAQLAAETCADQFGLWISRGSPAEKGLRRRRAIERAMFLGEDWKALYRKI